MRRASIWVAGLLIGVFALGAALVPLLTPAFTAWGSARYSLADEAGLSPARMSELAEQVRAFIAEDAGELPAEVDGRPAFDASAVSHLVDVRDVIGGARTATAIIAAVLFLAGALAVFRRDLDGVGRTMQAGAVWTGVLVAGAALFAFVDFDAFFAAFHSLFFAAGTWQFPADALLILVFPEPFWVTAGAAWALLVATIAASSAVLGTWLRRRAGTRPTVADDASTNPVRDEQA